MKELIIWMVFALCLSCKSTKTTSDNQLDVLKTEVDLSTKVIELDLLEFNLNEIIIVSADPSKETIITDSQGNKKTFKNIKSVTIKKHSERKEISKADEKKDITTVLKDTSKIKETNKSISDTVQYKWIFAAIALIVFFVLVAYLVFKFKRT